MRTIILLTLPVLLLGCVSSSSNRMGPEYPARPDDWPIAVYSTGTAQPEIVRMARSGTPEGKPIGRFRVSAPRGTEWIKLLNKARSEARSLGGDSVLVTKGDVYLMRIEGRIYRRTE